MSPHKWRILCPTWDIKSGVLVSIAFLTLLASSTLAQDELSLAAAPPVVVRTIPTAGSSNVSPATTEIQVTFSKEMQDGGWSWSTWGEENFPEVTGTIHYLDDHRTCVLPVKLKPGKFYATWLNSESFRNFKDSGGRPAVPYLLTFETAASGQASAPGASPAGTTTADPTKRATSTTAEPSETPAGGPLNADQLTVFKWTETSFRSFFDNRAFESWSEQERSAL
jgi:RNA polymerase sigma-70 factor (ECF subfamily)